MENVVRKEKILQSLVQRAHPLNPEVERHALSLGDLCGLGKVGIHFTLVKPGKSTTELHTHKNCDEFMFILSGEGTLTLDQEAVAVSEGDFIGLPARGPAHLLTNTGDRDLVYLVGGDRPDYDVCLYPRLGKRLYLYKDGPKRQLDTIDDTNVAGRTV